MRGAAARGLRGHRAASPATGPREPPGRVQHERPRGTGRRRAVRAGTTILRGARCSPRGTDSRSPAPPAMRPSSGSPSRRPARVPGSGPNVRSLSTESPTGTYASEAFGRKMILIQELRGDASARVVAQEYLNRFPLGTYAARARSARRTVSASGALTAALVAPTVLVLTASRRARAESGRSSFWWPDAAPRAARQATSSGRVARGPRSLQASSSPTMQPSRSMARRYRHGPRALVRRLEGSRTGRNRRRRCSHAGASTPCERPCLRIFWSTASEKQRPRVPHRPAPLRASIWKWRPAETAGRSKAGSGSSAASTGLGPAVLPVIRARFQPIPVLQVRVTGAWLGTQPSVRTPAGSVPL